MALILGGDGGKCAMAGLNVMAEYQGTAVQRSADGGASFADASSGIDSHDPKAWVGIFTKDPNDARTLYIGTSRVYRTTNFHDTPWVQILGPVYYSRLVTALAVSPVSRNVVSVGYYYGGLYRSANALGTSPSFANIKGGLPNRAITRVTPHPVNAKAAWVVVGAATVTRSSGTRPMRARRHRRDGRPSRTFR